MWHGGYDLDNYDGVYAKLGFYQPPWSDVPLLCAAGSWLDGAEGGNCIHGNGVYGSFGLWIGDGWCAPEHSQPQTFFNDLFVTEIERGERVVLLAGEYELSDWPISTIRCICAYDGFSLSPVTDELPFTPFCVRTFSSDPESAPVILAATFFTNPVDVNHLLAWDGQSWQSIGTGLWKRVRDIAVDNVPGGGFIVVGEYEPSIGQPIQRVVHWDGQSWGAIPFDSDGSVLTVELFDVFGQGSSSIVVGGTFAMVNGQPIRRVAAWNGESWLQVGNGLEQAPSNLVRGVDPVTGTESLFASSAFTGSHPTVFPAMWMGGDWRCIAPGNAVSVGAVAPTPPDWPSPPGLFGMSYGPFGDILGYGVGFWACPISAPCIADIIGDYSPYGSPNGVVDRTDLVRVINYWGSANPTSDINNDGLVGVQDLLLVIEHWGPCPTFEE